MNQYELVKDANRQPHGCIIAPPEHRHAYMLSAGTAKAVTIPTGARIALFAIENGTNVYVAYGRVATVPSADVTDGSAPELNPGAREVAAYATISLISATATIVVISFLA